MATIRSRPSGLAGRGRTVHVRSHGYPYRLGRHERCAGNQAGRRRAGTVMRIAAAALVRGGPLDIAIPSPAASPTCEAIVGSTRGVALHRRRGPRPGSALSGDRVVEAVPASKRFFAMLSAAAGSSSRAKPAAGRPSASSRAARSAYGPPRPGPGRPGETQLQLATDTPLRRIEDGFVRSVGLGSDLLPPCSIVVDRRGIYYDPGRPSDLHETILLSETEFTPGPPPAGVHPRRAAHRRPRRNEVQHRRRRIRPPSGRRTGGAGPWPGRGRPVDPPGRAGLHGQP